MDLFENFYAQDWVQVSTAFIYVVLILLTPILYWKLSRKISGKLKYKFVECAWEIYGVLFFLLLPPVGYLALYFMGSESKFMLNDPMAWVCLVGASSSIFDLLRSKMSLNAVKNSRASNESWPAIGTGSKLINIALPLSLIPLLYGAVMVFVTNMMNPEELYSILWFVTFLMTGWSIGYAVLSRSVWMLTQQFSSGH